MPRPSDVGVGVAIALVRPDGWVLMGKRRGSHGAGQWSFPGGWIDRTDQSIDAAAVREVLEETGLRIATPTSRIIETSIDFSSEGFRTITLFRFARISNFQVTQMRVAEPDKCEEWRWFEVSAPPSPLFGGVKDALNMLDAHLRLGIL